MIKEQRARWVGPTVLTVLVVSGLIKANPLVAWLPVDLTLLSAILVAVCMIVSRFRDGRAHRLTVVPILLWLLFVIALVPAEGVPGVDTEKHYLLFTVTLALALSPFYLLRFPDQRRAFGWATVWVGAIAAVLLFTTPETVEGFTSRFILEGSDSIGTGRMVAAGAVVAALATPPNRRVRIASYALAGVMAVASFAAGSRGPIVAAAAALVVTVVLARSFRKYRGRAIILLVLMGMVGVSFAQAFAADGFARIMSYLSGNQDASVVARQDITSYAWNLIEAHPFGTGWGTFTMGNGLFRYPHNLFLEVVLEAGWITGAVFIAICAVAGLRLIRATEHPTFTPLLALYVFAILNAAVSSDVNGNRLLWVTLFAAFAVSHTAGDQSSAYLEKTRLTAYPAHRTPATTLPKRP